jgi:hypothetical protein
MADRWMNYFVNGSVSFTLNAENDADRAAIGDEAMRYSLGNVFTGSATGGSTTQLLHRIEGVRRLSGKTVTLSFYAWAASALRFGVMLVQSFGTGGSPSPTVTTAIQTVTLGAIGPRYTMTFVLPSASGKTLGTNGDDYTEVMFIYSDPTTAVGVQSGNIAMWGVQLEIGSVATPLEKLDPADDLRHCQRFYQTHGVAIQGYNSAGSVCVTKSAFPVRMRAPPTITVSGNSGYNYSAPTVTADDQDYSSQATVTALGSFGWTANFTASADL